MNEVYVAKCVKNDLGTVCQPSNFTLTFEGLAIGFVASFLVITVIVLPIASCFFKDR